MTVLAEHLDHGFHHLAFPFTTRAGLHRRLYQVRVISRTITIHNADMHAFAPDKKAQTMAATSSLV